MITGLDPIIAKDAHILILGSMPSVTSLEKQEYYGYRFNRFWKVLASIYDCDVTDYTQKTQLILDHQLALWDVIHSCEREGSLDSAIRNEIVNPIDELLETYPDIHTIICNGRKSYDTYMKHFAHLPIRVLSLPSTSNANAMWKLDRLIEAWRKALKEDAYEN